MQEKGWVVLPSLLDETEVSVLNDAWTRSASMTVRRWRRTAAARRMWSMACILLDDRMAMLARHPALVAAVEKILGKQFFVHQSRVNIKQTDGSIVKWHQDFGPITGWMVSPDLKAS